MKLKPIKAFAVVDKEMGWTVAPFWHESQAQLYVSKQSFGLDQYEIVPVIIKPLKK